MATVEVKDMAGKKVGSAELSAAVFGVTPNTHAVHLVVRSQMAARRAGTHDTKTRGEVSGGGAKPFRQKGTGRARAGTTRAPQWTGGGAVFGPHPRSYAFKVPNKVVKLAMRSVLSAKAAEGDLRVVDKFDIAEPSTKTAAAALAALDTKGRVTVVVGNDDVAAVKSFRNIDKVRVITASESNTYDLVDNAVLVLTKSALEYLEGVLS
jgi:large subunit ribosomal protein L4